MNTMQRALRQGSPIPISGIIDMHGHLGRTAFGIPNTDPDCLVGYMDRCGVSACIVSHLHCMNHDWDSLIWGHDQVQEAMSRHPGRILGYFSVLPTDARRIRQEAETRLAQGFIGIKLHNANGFPYEHPGFEPLWVLANEHRLPVLYHTWGGPELAAIDRLAASWPGITHIMAHAGVVNAGSYIELAQRHANVVLDTCLCRSPRGLIERLVQGAGRDKIIWGSDAHFYSMSHQMGKVVGANLSNEELLSVLAGNARRILGHTIS